MKAFLGTFVNLFVTMANSFTVLEKLDSKPECNEESSTPIFKIPSPFWNQDSVIRKTRHVRESTPVTDAVTLYPYRYDLTSVPNPDISCSTQVNQIYPALSLNSMHTNSRYLSPSSKYSTGVPNTRHSIGRDAYYWSYLNSEEVARGFRNQHNPQIDPFLASYYYRGPVLSRAIPHEETKIGLQKDQLRGETYWSHRPQKQRIIHSSKKDHRKNYVKDNALLGSLLHTYSNINNHHQFTLNPPSPATCEESEQDSIKQTGEELHLLDWREGAVKHNQDRNSGICSTPSSSVVCELHRFVEGSLVELEGGLLKRVEDLQMEDLEQCAELHPEFRLERFTVLKIPPSNTPALLLEVELEHDHSQLTLKVNAWLPLFVCGRGWSSCNPQHTTQTCRLQCHQLKVGDVCLALTHGPTSPKQPANQSPAEAKTDLTAPKSDTGKKITLPKMDRSRKRHFTAPELREMNRVHHITL